MQIPAHDLSSSTSRSATRSERSWVGFSLRASLSAGRTGVQSEEFANRCGAARGVGVGTGHSALFVALKALGIGEGDEVITVANTDISTASAIGQCGARIVFVDIDEATFNIDPDAVEAAITSRTAAIIAVHLYGLPADLGRLAEISRRHGLALVEDAALAFGASVDGRPVGGIGDVGCFSFAPHKILGAYGDGGMITTSDEQLADKALLLAGYGERGRESMADSDGRLTILEQGYPRISTCSRLRSCASSCITSTRGSSSAGLGQHFTKRCSRASTSRRQATPAGKTHVFRNYVVRLKDRDFARASLASEGIETALLYVPPLHLQPVYVSLGYRRGSLPITEQVAEELLCLPVYPELSDEAVRRVAGVVRNSVDST